MNYWENFYKKPHTLEPTSFVKFFVKSFPFKVNLVDVGCGNGRDSYYLAKKGFKVLGIDKAIENKSTKNATFLKAEPWNFQTFDVVYSRFLLHCLTEKQIDYLIQSTPNYFVAEARSVGDVPVLYTNHKRHFIDGDKLIDRLRKNGFEIFYYIKGYKMAEYKNEDPRVIRVIAKRK